MSPFEKKCLQENDTTRRTEQEGPTGTEWAFLVNNCSLKSFGNGDTIYHSGSNIEKIICILKGSLVFQLSGAQSSARLDLREGDVLRFFPLIEREILAYQVTAKGDAKILEIPTDKVVFFPDKVQIFLHKRLEIFVGRLINGFARYGWLLDSRLKGISNYIAAVDLRLKKATGSQIIQDLINKIPKLPNFAFDLISKLQDKSVETRDVVAGIQSDPSLASLVLKTVNSSYYGLAEKVTDVYHAVLLLGFNNIYQLILSQGLSSVMPKDQESLEIQRHSILLSVLSQELAVMSGRVSPPTASTLALLHDIGKIVVLLLKLKYTNISQLFELLDTSLIGSKLLRAWGLPDSIYGVIEEQNRAQFISPDAITQKYRNEVALLYIGHLCHDVLMGSQMLGEAFGPEYISFLGLKADSVRHLFEQRLMPSLMAGIKKYPEHVRGILKDASRPAAPTL